MSECLQHSIANYLTVHPQEIFQLEKYRLSASLKSYINYHVLRWKYSKSKKKQKTRRNADM